MGRQISITVTGDKAALLTLREVRRQIPFALRQAANNTAVATQGFLVRSHMPSKLTVRGTWAPPGRRYGVNVNFARGISGGASAGVGGAAATSEVFSRARWLDFQERGGTKRPSAKKILVPVIGGARRSQGSVFTKNLKPRSKEANKAKGIFWNKQGTAVFQRKGKKGRSLKMLWSATGKSVAVAPRLGFGVAGVAYGDRHIVGFTQRAVAGALATSRRVGFTVR